MPSAFTHKHRAALEKTALDNPLIFTWNPVGLWLDSAEVKYKLKNNITLTMYGQDPIDVTAGTEVNYYVRVTPEGIYKIVEHYGYLSVVKVENPKNIAEFEEMLYRVVGAIKSNLYNS